MMINGAAASKPTRPLYADDRIAHVDIPSNTIGLCHRLEELNGLNRSRKGFLVYGHQFAFGKIQLQLPGCGCARGVGQASSGK